MNVRYNVWHRGEKKMVGKLYEQNGHHIFLHDEKRRSQSHWQTGSPGGIDHVVLEKLESLYPVIGDVWLIHRTTGGLTLKTSCPELRAGGIRATQGGRDRWFLPLELWERIDWELEPDPWVTLEDTLDPEPAPTPPQKMASPPPAPVNPQRPLFPD